MRPLMTTIEATTVWDWTALERREQLGVRGGEVVLQLPRGLSELGGVARGEPVLVLSVERLVVRVRRDAGDGCELIGVGLVVVAEHLGDFGGGIRQTGGEGVAIQQLGGQLDLEGLLERGRVCGSRRMRGGSDGPGNGERNGTGEAGNAQRADKAAPRRGGLSGFEVHRGVSFRGHASYSLPAGRASEQF